MVRRLVRGLREGLPRSRLAGAGLQPSPFRDCPPGMPALGLGKLWLMRQFAEDYVPGLGVATDARGPSRTHLCRGDWYVARCPGGWTGPRTMREYGHERARGADSLPGPFVVL